MRNTLILCTLLFCAFRLSAQVTSPADTLAAHQLVVEAIRLTDDREYLEAKKRLWKATSLLKKANALEINTYGKVLQQQGLIYIRLRQADSALMVIPKALELRTKLYGPVNQLNGVSYHNMGQAYQLKMHFDKALEYENKALEVFQALPGNRKMWISFVYNNMANTYAQKGELDKAIEIGKKALDFRLNTKPIDSVNLALSYNNLGIYYNMLGQYEKALVYLEDCLALRLAVYGEEHPDVAIAYSNLGSALYYVGDNVRAQRLVEKSLDIRRKVLLPDDLEMAESYTNLALPLVALGDYDRAVACARQSIHILGKNGILGVAQMGQPYLVLGNALLYMGRLAEAHTCFEKAIAYFGLIGNSTLVAKALNNISVVYEQKGDYRAQKNLMLQSLKKQAGLAEEHPERLRSYVNLGLVYAHLEQADSAFLFLNKAETTLQKQDVQSPLYPTLYHAQALVFKSQKKYDEALAILEKGKQANRYIQSGVFDNVTHMDNLLVTLSEIGNIWRTRSDSLQHPDHLERARAAFLETSLVADQLRTAPLAPMSKAAINTRIHKLFEVLIDTDWNLFQKTQDQLYRDEAFRFAEASKSFNLYLAVQRNATQQFAGVPDSVTTQEASLVARIQQLEGLATTSDSLARILLNTKQAYRDLLLRIQIQYPEYYQLKHSYSGTDYQAVQKRLPAGQSLLEFYWGTEAVYGFVMKKNSIDWFKVPFDSDFEPEKLLEQLHYGLTDYFASRSTSLQHYNQTAQVYSDAAYLLYQKIIQPAEHLLDSTVIIVPDGPLGSIPFDVLLHTKPTIPTRFHSHKYFGKKRSISYTYSAGLLHTMQQKSSVPKKSQPLFAMAPFAYPDGQAPSGKSKLSGSEGIVVSRDSLPLLRYSKAEAETAAKVFKGRVETGEQASKALFLQQAGNYRILHLATHAQADRKGDASAFIAFRASGDKNTYEKLLLREIYGLQLQADLVVLSACETGVGLLQPGEGIISLARAFAYAGAKSLVTTLWQADDAASAFLMERFYENMGNDNTTDKALTISKQELIAKYRGTERAHPYFWAGYIPVGAMR